MSRQCVDVLMILHVYDTHCSPWCLSVYIVLCLVFDEVLCRVCTTARHGLCVRGAVMGVGARTRAPSDYAPESTMRRCTQDIACVRHALFTVDGAVSVDRVYASSLTRSYVVYARLPAMGHVDRG